LTEREAYRLVTLTWPARWPAPGPPWRGGPVRPAVAEELPVWDTHWIETLTAALAAVGLVTAWAARRSRRWTRWVIAGGFVAVLIGLAVTAALFVARLPGDEWSYQAWFAASWTTVLAGGAVLVLARGLRRTGAGGGPTGQAWPLGRLAAVAGAAAALDLMTVSNLDLAQKVLLARERAEAGARVVSLLPPPVADRDNAATVYREAFAVLRPRDPATDKKLAKWLGRPGGVDPQDRDVTDFLREREPGLALLRKAAGMPGCRFESDYLHPLRRWAGDSGAFLGAGRLLALDARVRAGRGEPGPALADVAALYGMARHLDEPALLAVLVSTALDWQAGEALTDVVSRTTPTAAELAAVRPGDVSYQRAFRRSVEMENAAFGLPGLLAALEAESLRDWLVVRFVGEGVLGPFTGLEDAARRWVVGTAAYRVFYLAARRQDLQAALALTARWYWEARADWEARDRSPGPGRGGLLAQSLRVPLSRYARDAARADAGHRLAQLTVAAAAFRAATGKLPERADALVPEYLPAVPTDPFSGSPLRARRDGKTLVLYSVGPDGRGDGGGPVPRTDGLVVRLTDR
ncbi:MAG TPA: hypothetical protein VH092_25780, partial [Urbifossiella sp.]|nr:hypothetical protein [Urbifossiella sp.]